MIVLKILKVNCFWRNYEKTIFNNFYYIINVSFIYTNTNAINIDYDNEDIEIIGIVKYKKEKERYNEYIVGKFVVRDYTKYKKIKVGMK